MLTCCADCVSLHGRRKLIDPRQRPVFNHDIMSYAFVSQIREHIADLTMFNTRTGILDLILDQDQ